MLIYGKPNRAESNGSIAANASSGSLAPSLQTAASSMASGSGTATLGVNVDDTAAAAITVERRTPAARLSELGVKSWPKWGGPRGRYALSYGARQTCYIVRGKVLRKWRHRWSKSANYTPLWPQQVTKCLELASRCLHKDPTPRPSVWDIVQELKEFDGINSCLDDMLGIEPLEIHFPSGLDTQQSGSIQLTNDTDHYIAFRITTPSLLPFSMQPSKGVVPPWSKHSVTITLQAYGERPRLGHRKEELIVQSTRVDEGVTGMAISSDMFKVAEI